MVMINVDGTGRQPAGLPMCRVAAGGTVRVLLCSDFPLAIGTHWCGSSVVCVGRDCPLCEVGPSRVSVFSIVRPYVAEKIGSPCLLEMSAGSYARLDGLFRMEGVRWMAGASCVLSRRRANSPLCVEPITGLPLANVEALPVSTTLKAVCVLLKLPQPLDEEDPADWAIRMRPAMWTLAEKALARL